MGGIDRKLSIETEPRTLNVTQINIAREAAMYVMRTSTWDEACRIFTEGLEAMEGLEKIGKTGDYVDEQEEDAFSNSSCTCQAMKRDSIKDVFTAPF